MAECYHKTIGGRVTWVEMTRDEVEEAVKRAPHEWAASPRGFAPWPAEIDRVEVVEVELSTAADGRQMSRT
jgi:hypothetical protein